MIFSPVEIQETVNMFMRQKLDIRCITMGISLLDCADSDAKKACQKIYDKIMKKAGSLVKVGQDIEKELFDEFNNDGNKDKVVDDEVFTKIDEKMNDSRLPDISIDEYMKNFDENKISDTNSLFDEEDFPSIPM